MTAICPKCGRDCKTALALGKHETKGCEGPEAPPVVQTTMPDLPLSDRDRAHCQAAVLAMGGNPFKFTNWQETKGDFKTIAERCPRCSNEIAQFWKKDEWTWVCLECGINFTPRTKLRELIGIKDGTTK